MSARYTYTPRSVSYTAVISPCEEGGFWGQLAELPPVMTQGESIQEVEENLRICLDEYRDIARQEAEEQLNDGAILRPLVLSADEA